MSKSINSLDSNHFPLPSIQVTTSKKGHLVEHDVKRLNIDPANTKGIVFVQLKKSGDLFGKIKYNAQKALLFSGKYVKTEMTVTNGGQPQLLKVAINVNSLSKQLGISKQDIKELAKQGKLGEVLETVHKTSQARDEVHEFLGASAGQKLNAQLLTNLFTENALQRKTEINIGEKTLHLRGTVITSGGGELGKGGFGTAYKVNGLTLNEFKISEFVEKISNIDLDKPENSIRAVKDIENEGFNLNELTRLAKEQGRMADLKGGQEAPLSVSYQSPNGVQQGVMTGRLYLGDLSGKQHDLTTAQKLKAIDPLIKFMAFMQEQGLVHVDIKPENIFIDKDENGEIFFRLADFGGAIWEKDLPQAKEVPINQRFISDTEIVNEKDPNCLHQVGTFQMGVTLFYLLSGGEYPYPLDGVMVKRPDSSKAFNEEALAGYPKELVDFVKSMLDDNRTNRPTGAEMRQKWNKVVESGGNINDLAEKAEVTVHDQRQFSTIQSMHERAVKTLKEDLYHESDFDDHKSKLSEEECKQMLKDNKTFGRKFILRGSETDGYEIIGIKKNGDFVKRDLNDLNNDFIDGRTILQIMGQLLK